MSNQLNQNIQDLENILNDINNIPIINQATPSITVSSNGLITASVTEDIGYLNGTTTSTTKQLTTQAAKTITPSTSNQTAVASGVYTTGAITVGAIPSSYVKPSATKAAATITPGTSNQTIAAGTYCSGAQTIKGDSNLKAANIASGKSIFGVSGTFTGTPTLLWTNASPTSTFAAQTVNVNNGGYSAYIIETMAYTWPSWTDNTLYLNFINIGSTDPLFSASVYELGTGNLYCRKLTSVTQSVIGFGNGVVYHPNTGIDDDDAYSCVPTRIWGVKFTVS